MIRTYVETQTREGGTGPSHSTTCKNIILAGDRKYLSKRMNRPMNVFIGQRADYKLLFSVAVLKKRM